MRCCLLTTCPRDCATAVWSFYSSASNYKWRGKLALVLFELQQAGNATALQQVCGARIRITRCT